MKMDGPSTSLLIFCLIQNLLGIYYLLSAFIFGISGTLISVLIRIELYSSGNRIISPENQNFYNISITLHGFLMIFFLVMPGLFGGFGNYFVVIFQGSPEVVYPRVNNFSILILSLSYLFLMLSLISEFGGGTGWTLYPPLSTSFMSLSPSSTGNLDQITVFLLSKSCDGRMTARYRVNKPLKTSRAKHIFSQAPLLLSLSF